MPERYIDQKLRRRVDAAAFSLGAEMLRAIAAEPFGLQKAERYLRFLVGAAILETAWEPKLPESIRTMLDALPADEKDEMESLVVKTAQDAKIAQCVDLTLRKAGVLKEPN